MPNSPQKTQSPPQNPQNPNTQKRICDFCTEKVALLFCRADNAKLCLSCDREVHSTNQLFTKHTRFQLCDNCDLSPASILCFTEHSVLCQNCDYEVHSLNGSSLNHDRRPLEGFTGCPSVFELSGFVGCGDFDAKSLVLSEESVNRGFNGGLFGGLEDENDGFCDLFAWDVPNTMVSLDELIVSTEKSHNFQAMVVPPLPKDRNLSCGQHKHEILRQLCELSKSDPDLLLNTNPIVGPHIVPDEDDKDSRVTQTVRSSHRGENHHTLQGNEASPYNWCVDDREGIHDIFLPSSILQTHLEESALKCETPSGMCSSANLATNGWAHQYPVSNESPDISQKVSIRELVSVDRDNALSRYKEKKRTRRFEKHIRYESRKLQAENRTRIKGRFAKVDTRKNET